MSRPALLCGTMATGWSAGICVRSSRRLLTTRCRMATVDARLQQEANLDLVSRGGNPIRNARTDAVMVDNPAAAVAVEAAL
jgi:hypothetical protein